MKSLKSRFILGKKMYNRISKVNILASKNNLEFDPGLDILATKA